MGPAGSGLVFEMKAADDAGMNGVLAVEHDGVVIDEPLAAPEKALVLGTAPFLEHSLMERYFRPIASYLARTSGRPVEFVVGRDYSDFLEEAAQGTYDFWMSPPYPGFG